VTPLQVEAVLIDTDVYSYLMSGKGYASLYRPHVEGKLIAVSFITVGELYYGAYRKKWGVNKLADLKDRLRSVAIVPYDEALCRKYAEIKSACEANGKTVGDNDLWIAACAIRHSIPLVSNNFKHFNGIPGLVLRSESHAMQEMQSQMTMDVETKLSSSTQPQQPASSSASEATVKPPEPSRP
jgi:tRNA(fMet)-specific endonuclease VapC